MGFSRGSEVVPKHLAESERETQERTRTAQIEQRDAHESGTLSTERTWATSMTWVRLSMNSAAPSPAMASSTS